MTNGKGTFHALKRELAFASRVGSIRSIGEVIALRQLLAEECAALAADATEWAVQRVSIEDAMRDAGIEEDSRLEHHRAFGGSMLRSMSHRLFEIYNRDIGLIDSFLEERGIAAE